MADNDGSAAEQQSKVRRPARRTTEPKNARVNLRVPSALYESLMKLASKNHVSLSAFIMDVLRERVESGKGKGRG
jgi:predicted HicB family RNase H-like nuclease